MNITLRLANYISRYAPSRKKIFQYLEKKSIQNGDEVLQAIGYDENIMLDAWMRTFLNTGKSEQEIKKKLQLKLFPKEKILEKLEQFQEELYAWENFSFQIHKNIEQKIAKGKSKKIIEYELLQKFPYFKSEIQEILYTISDDTGLQKEIEKYRKKYNLDDKKEKEKFYQALMRKGFGYGDIKNFITLL